MRATRKPRRRWCWAIAAEAAKAYQDVIDRAGNRLIGQTARLGLAAAQARSGQFDQAITAYKELAQRKDAELPIDGILMELGRVYRDAGRGSDAQQTFNRVIDGVSGFAVQCGREARARSAEESRRLEL